MARHMSLKVTLAKAAVVLGSAQIITNALALLRNVILARLLAPADFGIAMTFALTVSLFEMATNASAHKFLIRAENGDCPELQASVQMFEAFRGAVLALIVFIAAPFFANWFGVPEAASGYRCLALIPLLHGFRHFDAERHQRHLQFRPKVFIELSSSCAALLLTLPVATWLADWSAAAAVLVTKAFVAALVSHLVSDRSYRWSFQREELRRLLTFGVPLMANGLLMFFTAQGDRALIGAAYNMEALALFSAASLLSFMPAIAAMSLCDALALPVLAKSQRDQAALRYYHRKMLTLMTVCGIILSAFCLTLNRPLLRLTFGAEYVDAGILVGLLGIAAGIRVLRAAPGCTAIAKGDTRNPLFANFMLLVGLMLCLAFTLAELPLWTFAIAAISAEISAFAYAIARLNLDHRIPGGHAIRCLIIHLASAGTLLCVATICHLTLQEQVAIGSAVVAATTVGLLLASQEGRRTTLVSG